MKCWASNLGGCDNISREHLVSKCLFKDTVSIQGYPWQEKDEIKTIGINSFVSKILCQTHNSMTSDLDEAALDAWLLIKEHSRLASVRRNLPNRSWRPTNFMIDGLRLERWCMKTMTNMFFSGSVRKIEDWCPPDSLVKTIFGQAALKKNAGLGFVTTIGDIYSISDSISIVPAFSEKNPVGGIIDLRGLSMVVTWDYPLSNVQIPPQLLKNKQGNNSPMRRLKEMCFPSVKANLVFNWGSQFPPERRQKLENLREKYKSE